ncbi:hypothetical protein [Natronococcus occultus]|uniref:Uncharacterized protein n=1 Tax=Natronococcus occultus SP4 TaxID=694430 RepID=L0JWW4_9EURY|nr:hypothetical protein [Natronococcus occultus]AGB37532.1 hypothetical protein Natoc_1728 [Natronococcus occultus SP4]
MSSDTSVQNDTSGGQPDRLPNLVTIVGRGVPSNFEIAVDGKIEMIADDPVAEGTVVSGGVAEGAIEVGVQRFRFSGQMANVHVVDWNGVEMPDSAHTPEVHVDYGVSNR